MSQETGEDQLIHLNQLLMSQDEASQQNQNYEYQSPSTMTVADVYPEESFTVKTFKAHPEWFGESGIALLYALHGAQQNPSAHRLRTNAETSLFLLPNWSVRLSIFIHTD